MKYIFISKIRSIGYGSVKCTGLLLDFTNLLCILNAFVHKSEVQLRTVSTAWLIEPVLRAKTLIGFPGKTFDHKNGIVSFIKVFWYGKY